MSIEPITPPPRREHRTKYVVVQPFAGDPSEITDAEIIDAEVVEDGVAVRQPAQPSWASPAPLVPTAGDPVFAPRRSASLDLPAGITDRRPAHTYWGGRRRAPLPWNPIPHMQEFLDEKRIQECGEAGLINYRLALSHFSQFALRTGLRHPEDLTRRSLLEYQAYLLNVRQESGAPLSQNYRYELMQNLRIWINWLYDLGYIPTNPWVRIKISKPVKKPRPIEPEELAALFEAHRRDAWRMPVFTYHRREVILTLLFAWGLRVHELHWLNVSNVDARLNWVTVRNKGGNTKVLPYNDVLKAVIQRWLRVRAQHADAEEDALIVDSTGKRLSITMIRTIVKDLGGKAGVELTPHRLRDTFGTTMLDYDVEVERISAMMGHTNTRQTLAYARVNSPKLAESHDRVMTPLLSGLLNGQPYQRMTLTQPETEPPEQIPIDAADDPLLKLSPDGEWAYYRQRGWLPVEKDE